MIRYKAKSVASRKLFNLCIISPLSLCHFSTSWQKLDEAYGPAWHCVVGKDFGSCITHLKGSFIFFHVEMMEFLIFKDVKDFSESKEEAVGVVYKANITVS